LIELRKAVKEIDINQIDGMDKSNVTSSGIKIERCKKTIQVVKKEGNKAVEIISVKLLMTKMNIRIGEK
jgi:hypothetical protein